MKMIVSNIKFESNSMLIKIPTYVQPIRDWLEDYKMPVPETNRECLLVYIRTLLFESNDINFDHEIVQELAVGVERQPWCLDAVDHKYDSYETVNIEFSYPETFYCEPDDDMIRIHKDSNDILIFDYLREYMPVKISVKEWCSEDLKLLVRRTFETKLQHTYEYIDALLTDEADFNGDAMATDKAEFNINEMIKELDKL
jgi:hypothetical protein